MTRKDYVLLAGALRNARTGGNITDREAFWLSGFDEAVQALADALATDNYRFDREKFMEAVNKK